MTLQQLVEPNQGRLVNNRNLIYPGKHVLIPGEQRPAAEDSQGVARGKR